MRRQNAYVLAKMRLQMWPAVFLKKMCWLVQLSIEVVFQEPCVEVKRVCPLDMNDQYSIALLDVLVSVQREAKPTCTTDTAHTTGNERCLKGNGMLTLLYPWKNYNQESVLGVARTNCTLS